ncbi:phospholipase [Sphingomonas sabuli]|uniref:Phospholipase n=1 Tax=Sphingomonas sabuli TaxID=2764186 RepID=A0A7G9L5H2_9SPHN|nr:phospholipase [Sphingomonas sabuli]QNM83871.1 phospholipase [Sphingomonas sabuli]
MSAPAEARTNSARLAARPVAAAVDALPAGRTALDHGAIAYRPAGIAAPMPLLVVMHGAGGSAANMLQPLEEAADRHKVLLLSLQSSGRTWDLIERVGRSPDRVPRADFGPDVRRTDAVLRTLFQRVPVDPRRIVIGGFSDGATYALSLGMANAGLFRGVIALSPGFFVFPDRTDTRQRLFVAHGRKDDVLLFAQAEGIAGLLRQAGADVRFRPFDGGHQISRAIVDEGLAFALGG